MLQPASYETPPNPTMLFGCKHENMAASLIMESMGYIAEVRQFLMNCPHIGLAKLCDREDACVWDTIDWAYEVQELTGTPIWEFIKEQALQVVIWEEMVRLRPCWSVNPPSVIH